MASLVSWVAGLFPGFNTASKALHIFISHVYILYCLTGSAGLFGSGTVEDYFLILSNGWISQFKLPV